MDYTKDFIDQEKDNKDYTIYDKFLSDSNLKGILGKFDSSSLIPILKAFESYKWEYNLQFCNVCGIKLTEREKDNISEHNFRVTCFKHIDKADCFILK